MPKKFVKYTGRLDSDDSSVLSGVAGNVPKIKVIPPPCGTAEIKSSSSSSDSENETIVTKSKCPKNQTIDEVSDFYKSVLAEPAKFLIQIPSYDPDRVEYVREIIRKHNQIPDHQTSVRYDLTSPSRSPSRSKSSRSSSSSSSSSVISDAESTDRDEPRKPGGGPKYIDMVL